MAKLYINKNITREGDKALSWLLTGEAGISYDDVNAFLLSLPDDEGVDIELYSCGGDCTEGFAIYDALRTCGRELSTTVVGECASMATVLLLCAPRERRRAYKHARFLMHEPYYPDSICGDVTIQRIDTLRDGLEADRQKIRDIYVERTGCTQDVIEAQMAAGTWFDVSRAMELGLIAEVVPETAAAARGERISTTIDLNTEDMKKDENKGAVARAFHTLATALGLSERVVGLSLTATDGTLLNIDVSEGADIAIGVAATPDGVFTLEDGRTITIADGQVTEIVEPLETTEVPQDDAAAVAEGATDDMLAKIGELEAVIAELKEQLAEMERSQKTAEEEEVLSAVQRLGGMAYLRSVPVAKVNIPTNCRPQGAAESNAFAELLASRKSKN